MTFIGELHQNGNQRPRESERHGSDSVGKMGSDSDSVRVMVNRALLGKGVWRFSKEEGPTCRTCTGVKYGPHEGGWCN